MKEACFKHEIVLCCHLSQNPISWFLDLMWWSVERLHSPGSHLKTDLPWLSKEGLCGKLCVWVRPPQMRRAACGLDGNLIRRRWFQPWLRVRSWTKSPRVHGWVVKFLTASLLPVAVHCPALKHTVIFNNNLIMIYEVRTIRNWYLQWIFDASVVLDMLDSKWCHVLRFLQIQDWGVQKRVAFLALGCMWTIFSLQTPFN